MHPLLARVCAPSIFLDIIDYIKGRKPKKSSPQTKEKKVGINWTDDLEKELELVSKRQSSSKIHSHKLIQVPLMTRWNH
jgi:hypothetical protein